MSHFGPLLKETPLYSCAWKSYRNRATQFNPVLSFHCMFVALLTCWYQYVLCLSPFNLNFAFQLVYQAPLHDLWCCIAASSSLSQVKVLLNAETATLFSYWAADVFSKFLIEKNPMTPSSILSSIMCWIESTVRPCPHHLLAPALKSRVSGYPWSAEG